MKSSRSSYRHWIGFEREVHVGAQVVDPDFLGPGFFAPGFLVEEEHIGLDALGIEDAGRQAQQRMDIESRQQPPANCLAGPAFEEHIVRHDHRRAPVDLSAGWRYAGQS